MDADEVNAKVARIAEIVAKDNPPDAEGREAIRLGLDLVGGFCLNIARIAAALEKNESV